MNNKSIDFKNIKKENYYNFLFSNLEGLINQKDEISIFYIGNSFSPNFLDPLLDELKSKRYKVTIGIDRSKSANIEKLVKQSYTDSQLSDLYDGCLILDIDLDSTNIFLNNKKSIIPINGFDIIFGFFEHHHLINWRLGCINLFKYLAKNGCFIFGEVNGDIELLDGNFKKTHDDKLSRLKDILLKFDSERSDHFFWKPEISVTNYKELRFQIGRLFNEVVQTGSDENTFRDFEAGFLEFSRTELIELIEKMQFKFLSYGLEKDDTPILNLIKNISHEFKENEVITFNYNLRIYLAIGYNPKWLKSMTSRKWNFTSIFKDIEDITENSIESLSPRALDILLSHDMVLPEHTNYLALIEQRESDNNFWSYPIYFLTNNKISPKITSTKRKSEIEKWIIFENESKVSLARSIFFNSKAKAIVKFNFVNSKVFEENLNDIELNSLRSNIKYQLKFDRKAKPKQLNLFIDIDKIELNELEYHSNFLEEKETTIISEKISKIKLEIKDSSFLLNQFNTENDSLEKEEIVYKILGINSENLDKLIQVAKYSNFRHISKIDSKENSFHSLTFIPSVSYEKNQEQIGLGGLILFEKEISLGHRKISDYNYSLVLARNRILLDVTNLIFYKASLINYVNKDFKAHARRAAIAAINSRNYAHIMGSHVLLHASTVDYSTMDYQNLTTYLKNRSEYITQLTSQFPSWTYSANILSDILEPFLLQKILLNGLITSEGINYDTQESNRKLLINFNLRLWENINPLNFSIDKILNDENLIDFYKINEPKSGISYVVISKIENNNVHFLNIYHNEKYYIINETVLHLEVGDRMIVELISIDLYLIKDYVILYKLKKIELITNNFDINYENDFKINIPGGAPGCHALYIILENIIRNAAKHNSHPKDKTDLMINIECEERINNEDENIYLFKAWASNSNLFNKKNRYNHSYLNGCTFNITDVAELPNNINNLITEDIIEPSGDFIINNLGISEIKISAFFLSELEYSSNIKVSLLKDISTKVSGVIRASQIWEANIDKKLTPHLGYRFIVKKPRDILIISDKLEHKSIDVIKHHKARDYETSQTNKNTSKLLYNFCVFVNDPDNHHELENNHCFIKLLKFCIENIDNEEKLKELVQRIENYPFRIFVLNGLHLKIEIDNQIKKNDIRDVQKLYLLFIKARVNFLGDEINLQNIDSKILYEKWILNLNKAYFNNIKFNFINNSNIKNSDLDFFPTKKSKSEKQMEDLNENFVLSSKDNKKSDKIDVIINYVRHNNGFFKSNDYNAGYYIEKLKNQKNCIYEDNLTGNQISFTHFYNLHTQQILKYKLYETALNNVMVIDERVYAFFNNPKNKKNEGLKRFESICIIHVN